MAERVRLRVVDQQLEPAVGIGAVDPRRLVAGDVEPPVDVEGQAVRQAPERPSRNGSALAGRAVRADRDAETRRANVSATYSVRRSAESAMPLANRSGRSYQSAPAPVSRSKRQTPGPDS